MTDRAPRRKTIRVDTLSRVEGEGALYIKIKDDRLLDVKLKIFEPPRFFEAFLRGRRYDEAPDITARICGICPVAYQMSAVHAMENACGVTVDGPLRALRRLLYCGEWIESHVLHVYMLHGPDFLGYPDAIQMAKDHSDVVKLGLRLKKTGNDIVTVLGGREIHPINVRVGGFYKVPSRKDLASVAEKLKWAVEGAQEMVRWSSRLPFPEFERDYEFVALHHPDEYPFNEGRIKSSHGLDLAAEEFDDYVDEEHVAHSNALHATVKGRGPYCVGPLARYHLNSDNLSPLAQEAAREANLSPTCQNPFQSILVRSLETLHACDEALRLVQQYEPPDRPAIDVEPRAGIGYGCTEAPRGMLLHRYCLDERGMILDCSIVPPTSQNLRVIESDLWEFVPKLLNLPDDKLTWQCEQAIRNYDPCISCATHALRLEVDRV